MPKPVSENIRRWDGGLTTDLRSNFETPKFARMWNFKAQGDSLVQRYGYLPLSGSNGHILVGSDLSFPQTNQPTVISHLGYTIYDNGADILVDKYDLDATPSLLSTTNVQAGQLINFNTVPVLYQDFAVYYTASLDLFYTDFATSTQILQTDAQGLPITLANRIFMVSHSQDGRLYVGSGRDIHSVKIYPAGLRVCTPDEQVEFTLQRGDRDGNSNIANPTVITSTIANMQALLNATGFPSGPVDGIFGPLTEAGVIAFQTFYNIPAGGPYTGVVTAEVAAKMNESCAGGSVEIPFAFKVQGEITAMAEYGGYLAIATIEENSHAYVYLWNRESQLSNSDSAGQADSIVDMGYGAVQILNVVDGDLIAVMSPASTATKTHYNTALSIKKIAARFDTVPQSQAFTVAEYELRQGNNTSLIAYKSVVFNSKLYFMGKFNFQHVEDIPADDEGIMWGIFSVTAAGDLQFESTISDEFTEGPVNSFDLIESGFLYCNGDGTFVTDETATDVISGFITSIYNGGDSYIEKKLERIIIGVEGENTASKVEIWVREVGDINDADAGWRLACETDFSTYDPKFQERIVATRMDDGTYFCDFRELQVMVRFYGLFTRVANFTIDYKMLNLNK